MGSAPRILALRRGGRHSGAPLSPGCSPLNMLGAVSSGPIDDYLATVAEPARSTLQTLRERIRAVLPTAQECLSYGVPTFQVDGVGVAGFAAFKKHCSYFPFSGSVLESMSGALADYSWSKGTLRFPNSDPLPAELVEQLVSARLAQIQQT